MFSLAMLERAALDFANELRARDGKQPASALEAGVCNDTFGCPIANTAPGWQVGHYATSFDFDGSVVAQTVIPGRVKDFMAAFDAGMYPHLVAREAVTA